MRKKSPNKELLDALQKRLAALTLGLDSAEIQGKGIDLVKEIKELHNMLEALHGQKPAEPAPQPRVIVVWGDASASPPPCGTGRRSASTSTRGSARSSARGKTKPKTADATQDTTKAGPSPNTSQSTNKSKPKAKSPKKQPEASPAAATSPNLSPEPLTC